LERRADPAAVNTRQIHGKSVVAQAFKPARNAHAPVAERHISVVGGTGVGVGWIELVGNARHSCSALRISLANVAL
jgi:hypothetical protein